MLFIGVDSDPDRRAKAIAELQARQVDGLLVGAMYHRSVDVGPLPAGLPTVGYNAVVPGVACFVPDDRGVGIKLRSCSSTTATPAGRHLTEFPTDGLAKAADPGIRRCFGTGVTEARVHRLATESRTAPSDVAERAALGILSGPEPPTAILAFTDLFAVGVYRAARQLGVHPRGPLGGRHRQPGARRRGAAPGPDDARASRTTRSGSLPPTGCLDALEVRAIRFPRRPSSCLSRWWSATPSPRLGRWQVSWHGGLMSAPYATQWLHPAYEDH